MPQPYFMTEALQADFLRDVQDAWQSGALSADLQQRMRALTLPDPSGDTLTVHHVQASDGLPLPCALAGAILMRENDATNTTVYLHTAWHGLQTFTDPQALTASLRRLIGVADAAFDQVLLDGPLFRARMGQIFEARLTRLERFWQTWAEAPHIPLGTETSSAEQALDDFWHSSHRNGKTPREQLADVLADAYQHTVIQAEHEQLITREEAHWLKHAAAGPHARKLALYTTPNALLKLAGSFVLHHAQNTVTPWFLYMPDQGLHLFADREAMLAWLVSQTQRHLVLGALSLDEQVLLREMVSPNLRLDAPSHALFLDRADALIGWQKRNLGYALALPEATDASLQAATDLRHLIDPALPRFGAPMREPLPGIANESALPAQALALQQRLHAIEARLVDLPNCATRLLNRGLAIFDTHLPQASEVEVTVDPHPSGSGTPRQLTAVLLQRLTQAGMPNRVAVAQLPDDALATLLRSCQQRLEPAYKSFFDDLLRDNFADLVQLRKHALALELQLQRLLARIDARRLGWFEQVLHTPTQAARQAQGSAACTVYGLAIDTGLALHTLELANAFVIAASANRVDDVLLWTAVNGLETFDSWQALYTAMDARLRGVDRQRWLALMPDQRLPASLHGTEAQARALQFSAQAITGDVASHLQTREHRRRVQAVARAWTLSMAARLPAQAMSAYLAQAGAQAGLSGRLEMLVTELHAAQLEQVLPAWLKNAAPQHRREYAAALTHLAWTEANIKDYRFGIEPLNTYARARIIERFQQVQPLDTPDPDKIQIELTAYTTVSPWLFGHGGFIPEAIPAFATTSNDTLTAYAISHFSLSQTAVLRARMSDGTPVPSWMTPPELHRLVDTLDISGHYRQLLTASLNKTAARYTERQNLFATRSFAQLRVAAIQARLAGDLSATGFAYVEALLKMPDGLARTPVNGQAITLRPMTLVPAPGMAGDRVAGLCLIGPHAQGSGPVVLYVSAGADFVFKEFANDTALVVAAQAPGALQDLIVQQVPAASRSRYEHGGLRATHLPTDSADIYDIPLQYGPPTLENRPFTGNAWQLLFADRVQLIKALAISQSVSGSQAHWASFKFLMGRGIEQVTFLAEGRLARLLALWGGITQAQAAVQSSERYQWGDALGQMAYALFLLAPLPDPSATSVEAPERWVATDPLLEDELRLFEAPVALDALTLQPSTGLYTATDGTLYASVAGRVYPVTQAEDETRIGGALHPGPLLQTEANGQWRIGHLWDLRYGCFQSRQLKPMTTSSAVGQILTIRAVGIPDIRRLSRAKVRAIGQAYIYAKQRVEIALDNLGAQQPARPLPARSRLIIGDFFGVAHPSPGLLANVYHAISQLFSELMESSLSPWSSPRYAFGENLPENTERIMAMVAKSDPARRIFLTELFFDLPARIRYHRHHLLRPFDLPAHVRGATLIHELSHLVNDSDDISYLEAAGPYPDLIDPNDPIDPRFKADMINIQQTRLSLSTPRTQLFQRLIQGIWHPLDSVDAEATARVLKETGSTTLDEARDVFYADSERRAAVILANADSVAMLIMLLGREPFTP